MKRIFSLFILTALFLQVALVTTNATAAPAPTIKAYAPLISNPFTFFTAANTVCKTSGLLRLCAYVSNGLPARYTNVTVYGRLTKSGIAQPGKAMTTVWHYKTTTPICNTGITNANGLAACVRYISSASAGYKVLITVTISGVTVNTFFTPH